MTRAIIQATLIAGTLDILAAAGMTLLYGRPVTGMLRAVASGPFPAATGWGDAGAALGLLVHFVLMAIMVVIYFQAAQRMPQLVAQPVKWGVLYGVATYLVMTFVVVFARFGTYPTTLRQILPQLCFHIFLVGIPIALIAARALRGRASA